MLYTHTYTHITAPEEKLPFAPPLFHSTETFRNVSSKGEHTVSLLRRRLKASGEISCSTKQLSYCGCEFSQGGRGGRVRTCTNFPVWKTRDTFDFLLRISRFSFFPLLSKFYTIEIFAFKKVFRKFASLEFSNNWIFSFGNFHPKNFLRA